MELSQTDLTLINRALMPLAVIADHYHANNLDDSARKYWGNGMENDTAPSE